VTSGQTANRATAREKLFRRAADFGATDEVRRSWQAIEFLMSEPPYSGSTGVFGALDAFSCIEQVQRPLIYIRGWVFVPGDTVRSIVLKDYGCSFTPAEPRKDVADVFAFFPASLYSGFEGSFPLSTPLPVEEQLAVEIQTAAGRRILAQLPLRKRTTSCPGYSPAEAAAQVEGTAAQLLSIVFDGRRDFATAVEAARQLEAQGEEAVELSVVLRPNSSLPQTYRLGSIHLTQRAVESGPLELLRSLIPELSGTVAVVVGSGIGLPQSSFHALRRILAHGRDFDGICGPLLDENGGLSGRGPDIAGGCDCLFRSARLAEQPPFPLIAVRPERLQNFSAKSLALTLRYEPSFFGRRNAVEAAADTQNEPQTFSRPARTVLCIFDPLPIKERSMKDACRARLITALGSRGTCVRLLGSGELADEWHDCPYIEHIPEDGCAQYMKDIFSSSNIVLIAEEAFFRMQDRYAAAFSQGAQALWLIENREGEVSRLFCRRRFTWTVAGAPAGCPHQLPADSDSAELLRCFEQLVAPMNTI
jgi:hypothetical protein